MSHHADPIVTDPEFAPFWSAIHERLCSGVEPGQIATLKVKNLSQVAVAELRSWLDTTTRRRRDRSAVVANGSTISLPLRELLAVLDISPQDLAPLAEKATGRPVVNRAAARKEAAGLRQDLWTFAAKQLPGLPGLVGRMRAAGVGDDESSVRQSIIALAAAVSRLPAHPPVSLPKLAHDCAGDPHHFDLNTLNGARLVTAVAELSGRSEPSRPDHVRAMLADIGILADRLSSTVLLHNVKVAGDGVLDRRLRDSPTPVPVHLLDLTLHPPTFAPQVLTVVENPSVLEAALAADAGLPLACTSGHLRGVDHALLQLVHDQGVALRYAGDLDPDGRHVAAYIAEHYGAELIAMDTETITEADGEPVLYQEHDAILRRILSPP
ncbi:TIGR02679 domain-containing protein [Spirillospora sp. NPDC029432]|uniref:TIGR02679 domain-containing protein n=1 Tax=Spirillospora sp. NPDC029432 TaxID=3154599 RepID=UPI003453BF5A